MDKRIIVVQFPIEEVDREELEIAYNLINNRLDLSNNKDIAVIMLPDHFSIKELSKDEVVQVYNTLGEFIKTLN